MPDLCASKYREEVSPRRALLALLFSRPEEGAARSSSVPGDSFAPLGVSLPTQSSVLNTDGLNHKSILCTGSRFPRNGHQTRDFFFDDYDITYLHFNVF